MEKYIIEQVNIKDPVSGETNGRKWQRWGCGVKIKGEWYNQSIFDERKVNWLKSQEGKEVPLELYEEEYKGNKEEYKGKKYKMFKIPTKQEYEQWKLTARVDNLEQKVRYLEGLVDGFLHPAKVESSEAPPETPDEPEQNDLPF